MKSRLTRRALFSMLARPFGRRPEARPATAPREAVSKTGAGSIPFVAVIQGRQCLALTSFCASCVERCPVPGAMRVVNGMPQVVPEACTGCGICHQVCPAPTNAVLLLPRRQKPSRPATPVCP